MSGCGWVKHGGPAVGEMPVSHAAVKEMVLRDALAKLSLPEHLEEGVVISVKSGGESGDLLRILAASMLKDRGFRVFTESQNAATLELELEKLSIVLTDAGEKGPRLAARNAEAHIVATVSGEEGRRVFTADGHYNDRYPVKLLAYTKDPHVIDKLDEGRLFPLLKPLAIGTVLTVIAWMLYSYRA